MHIFRRRETASFCGHVYMNDPRAAWQPRRHTACSPRAGEAITHKIMAPELVSILFLVVALSMALTPFLADGGARLSKAFDKGDMKARPQSSHMYLFISISRYRCQDGGCWIPKMQLQALDKGNMKGPPPGLT